MSSSFLAATLLPEDDVSMDSLAPRGPLAPGSGDSLGGALIASSVITWVIALVFVAVRIYTRSVIVRVRGADDWTILLALFFSLGTSIANIVSTQHGWGRHVWTLSPDDFVSMSKCGFAITVLYMFSLAFTKVSILLLYLRILTYRNARWIVYVVLAVVILYNVVGFCFQMTQCVPLEKLWNSTVYGTCHPESFLWAVVALHVSTDFIIFALPIPIIANMTSVSMRQKLTLVALFGIGFCACVISIVRAVEIRMVWFSTDYTWDWISISHWNLVEVNIAIVCACMMTYKPLISRIWPNWLPPSGNGAGHRALREVQLDERGRRRLRQIPRSSKPSVGDLQFVSDATTTTTTTTSDEAVRSTPSRLSVVSSEGLESESSNGFPAERVESLPDVEAALRPAPVHVREEV